KRHAGACCAFPETSASSAGVRPEQIQERKEKDPDDVHKVPVETRTLQRRVVREVETTLPGRPDERRENAQSDDHVQGVQAGHHEVEREEDLRLLARGSLKVLILRREMRAGNQVVGELVGVLLRLDTQE